MGVFELGSLELFTPAGFEPQSSSSLPLKLLGLQELSHWRLAFKSLKKNFKKHLSFTGKILKSTLHWVVQLWR
jgi:hypothetical protein